MLVSQAIFNSALVNQSALAASSTLVTGVNLPYQSGTRFLHQLLFDTAQTTEFAGVFVDAHLPASSKDFGRTYRHAVMNFEGARAASPDRAAVAAYIAELTQGRMEYVNGGGEKTSLAVYMLAPADPLDTETVELGPGTMMPRIPYGGTTHAGTEIRSLANDVETRNIATTAAADALRWIIDHGRNSSGHIDLKGQKFVIMGASAELAPTQLLLEAGADVLWLNRSRPSKEFLAQKGLSGTITFAPEGADILNQPREIAETIEKFTSGDSVHIGAFAYAPNKALEWRISAAMNAIIRRLQPETVRSVSTFISPTSPIVTEPEDVRRSMAGVPVKHMLLSAACLFGRLKPGHHRYGDIHIADTIVPIQRIAYQGAQYVEKILAAESIALFGNKMTPGSGNPIPVSATVAGISQTQNMQIPEFQLAFIGAPSFGLETYAPETTRWLSGLIMLSDLLNPQSPASAIGVDPLQRARQLFSRQVHGGIYAHPYALNEIITLAGLVGANRNKKLAWRAWKSRGKKKS